MAGMSSRTTELLRKPSSSSDIAATDGWRHIATYRTPRDHPVKITLSHIGMSGWLILGMRDHISGLAQVTTLAAPQWCA